MNDSDRQQARALRAALRIARQEHVSMVGQYGADADEVKPYAEALTAALAAWEAFMNGATA